MEPDRRSGFSWATILRRRETLRRVAGNTAWIGIDSVLRLLVAFFVGIWVARTLGPQDLGLLSFSIAFVTPFSAIVSLGLNGLVVRDLVREPEAVGEILGTTFGIKLVGGLAAVIVGITAATLLPRPDGATLLLIGLVMVSIALQSGDVFDLAFQGEGRARISAWVRSGASLVVNSGKILLILFDAPLVWFAGAVAMEGVLCLAGLWLVYRWPNKRSQWSYCGTRALRLLSEAWPVAVAGVAVQVQAYFDQVVLASLRGPADVGYYAVALKFIVLASFIPSAVNLSAGPEITRAHQSDKGLYLRRLRDLYRVMFVAFLIVGLPLALFPSIFVDLLFGEQYLPAASLLPLLTLRILLTSVAVVRALYVANEGILVHAMTTALIGAAVNVGLNMLLISRWGALGCVVAAIVSISVSTVLLEVFHSRARINLRVMGAAVGFGRLPVGE